MIRSTLCCLVLAASAASAATNGELDWNRRILVGHGRGTPNLDVDTVSAARMMCERAATVDAARNTLELLKGVQITTGGNVGSLLQDNDALTARLDGTIRGLKGTRFHYFSDGGCSIDVELALDELPAELAAQIKVPEGVKALAGTGGKAAPSAGEKLPDGSLAQIAQGQAAVTNGDKPAARERAIEDALRHAVEMAVGTRVTSTTEVRDFATRMDQVFSHSQGFVKKYDILKEGMDGDVVQITVKAIISTVDLDKDLAALGLLKARKGYPRAMVLVAEQNIGMVAPRAYWMKGGAGGLVSADLRVAETVILDTLRNGAFDQLIDPEIVADKAVQVGGLTTDVNAAQARKLRSLTGAEVIIVGQVMAQSRGEMAELGEGWRSCTATITGRAVNTDNGDILATSDTTQNAAQLDDMTCGKEAIKKASRIFAQDMIKKVGERWTRDVSGGNPIRMVVSGLTSFKQASEFRAALGRSVRAVKSVSQRNFAGGKQDLDLTVVGTTDKFAEDLDSRKVGKFTVHVMGVTANTIEVELGK